MKRKQTKPREPRNNHAINAHMRNSSGVMGVKKGRKNTKKYDRLREGLEEALEILKEIEQDREDNE